MSAKQLRLIEWNVDVLQKILKAMIARRSTSSKISSNEIKKIRSLEMKQAQEGIHAIGIAKREIEYVIWNMDRLADKESLGECSSEQNMQAVCLWCNECMRKL